MSLYEKGSKTVEAENRVAAIQEVLRQNLIQRFRRMI
ncbi:unnamed protein product [Penicillium camemberti]|uniref:Str. FM013 n=1 Tax=Penicillium camemberti (strain FM 013) TaxID=1429867 RepID=A0A0G4P6M8_PENC3|nr:unnamed protein product [Penicillium camemberti]